MRLDVEYQYTRQLYMSSNPMTITLLKDVALRCQFDVLL